MKVKNYFKYFLTNPHIGCMRDQFCILSAQISTKTDKEHDDDVPVEPITIIARPECMTVRPAGVSEEGDE